MEFVGLTDADFAVFEVPGLAARMDVLKVRLRPKLEQLGRDLVPYLTDLVGCPMYAHVAKHARRTVNPPDDSWVAFCPDRRGYKKHPHFQIGLWRTHAFAAFGLIYESPARGAYAARLKERAGDVLRWLPPDYVWMPNHMDPTAIPTADLDETSFLELVDRLAGRHGELLAGITIPRGQAAAMPPAEFEERVKECFATLQPLVRLALSGEVQSPGWGRA
ncbi:MAG: DUF1054 domain-containing protein [Alicyclobacillaceae bacterium]|nr:DUF1054 domain-containing protein [Alicyclobacillaceae bacterium]